MRQFDFGSPALHTARRRRDIVRMPSELAIVGFAAFSLIAAIGMSYYCGIGLSNAGGTLKPAADVPVYEGKAVPRDHVHPPLGPTEQVAVRAFEVTDASDERADEQSAHPKDGEKTSASHQASALPQAEPLYSFPDLDVLQHAAGLGSASALAASVSSQYASAGIEAPDGAFTAVAPVPESSNWSFAGLFALVLCVGERLRRRATAGF